MVAWCLVLCILAIVLALFQSGHWPVKNNRDEVSKPRVPVREQSRPIPRKAAVPTRATAPSTASAVSRAGGVVPGWVLDPYGEPVPDSQVQLYPSVHGILAGVWPETGDAPPIEHSDETGRFVFRTVSDGAYVVVAQKDAAIAWESVLVKSGVASGVVMLVLREGGSISGTVVDASGSSISGAYVAPAVHNDWPVPPAVERSFACDTGTDGQFTLTSLLPYAWRLRVSASGFATRMTEPIDVGTAGVTITILRGGSLSGRCVHASDGAPVPGVKVVAKEVSGTQQEETLADDAGKFAFEALPEGTYMLASGDLRLIVVNTDSTFQVFDSQDVTDVELRLDEGGVVRGRVFVSGTGEGVAGATIGAGPVEPTHTVPGRLAVSAAPDGSYEVRGLAPALYAISMNPPHPYAMLGWTILGPSRLIRVNPGQAVEGVDFTLPELGLALSGTVVLPTGEPAPFAKVTARTFETACDSEGHFDLYGCGTGESVTLVAWTTDRASTPHGPYSPGEEDVTVTLDVARNCAVSGRVVDSFNRPARVGVMLEPLGDVPWLLGEALTFTDMEGAFTIAGLCEGVHDLKVGGKGTLQGDWGSTASAMQITLGSGEHLAGLRIVLDDSLLSIRGHVLYEDGGPVRGATIRTEVDGRRTPVSDSSEIDGSYELWGLPAGDYTVEASPSRRGVGAAIFARSQSRTVPAGSEGVDFILPRPATVSGRVIDSGTGSPVTAFRMCAVRGVADIGQAFETEAQLISDPNGAFVMTVAPGFIQLGVRASGFAQTVVKLGAVHDGESKEGVIVSLDPSGPPLRGKILGNDGRPVSGAKVYVGAHRMPFPSSGAAAVSTQDGVFEIESSVLPTDTTVELTVVAAGWAPSRVFFPPSERSEVQINLAPEAVVSGTVLVNGSTPENCSVYASFPDGDGLTVEVPESGEYAIEGLPEGIVDVTLFLRAQRRHLSYQAELRAGYETIVDFDLSNEIMDSMAHDEDGEL